MNYNKILNQIIVLFLIMIVGFFARKKNIINAVVNKSLSELMLNITLPFMIVASFNFAFDRQMLIKSGGFLLISLGIYIVTIPLSALLYYKYPHRIKGVLRFVTIFSNCGYMGYPVVESVYGKAGVFYTAIFNIPFNILIWTVGIMVYQGKNSEKSLRKIIFNPGIIAVVIGLIIFLFSIKIPDAIYQTLDIVGDTTTPISMIVIGSMLAEMKLRDIFSSLSVYYVTAVRLILIPMALLFILRAVGAEEMFLGIPVLVMAMPAAVNTAIVAEKYGGDAPFASKCIFISTTLSAVTIPLIISLM